MSEPRSRLAVYPGSFDPLTNGHVDIIRRGARLFDRIVIAILINVDKSPLFSVDERVEIIRQVFRKDADVEVETFNGLLVDYAARRGADVIVRGLRAISDFELEMQMALMNRRLSQSIETVFMMPDERLHLSQLPPGEGSVRARGLAGRAGAGGSRDAAPTEGGRARAGPAGLIPRRGRTLELTRCSLLQDDSVACRPRRPAGAPGRRAVASPRRRRRRPRRRRARLRDAGACARRRDRGHRARVHEVHAERRHHRAEGSHLRAGYAAAYGVTWTPDQVIATAGGKQAHFQCSAGIVRPRRRGRDPRAGVAHHHRADQARPRLSRYWSGRFRRRASR